MGYGKELPNIGQQSPVVKHKEQINQASLKSTDGILPSVEPIETLSEIDIMNGEILTDYYNDNPDQPLPHEILTDNNGNAYIKKQEDKYASKRKEGKIIITQSLIKKLVNKYQEELEFCPRHIKECVLDKTSDFNLKQYHDYKELHNFLKGKFFESLITGETTDTDAIIDLPRNKRKGKLYGTKTLDQERIENQAERFKLKAKELGADIIKGVNTHVTIFKRWDDKYMLGCELDWFPVTILYEGVYRLAMIDIKLTADVNSTFGAFSWANPKHMDHVQGDMYHLIVRDIDLELNPSLAPIFNERVQEIIKANQIVFLYWVWGYAEPLEDQERFVEREYQEHEGNNHRQNELKERIRKVTAILDREEHFGWNEHPCDNCSKCSLNKKFGGPCYSSIITKV